MPDYVRGSESIFTVSSLTSVCHTRAVLVAASHKQRLTKMQVKKINKTPPKKESMVRHMFLKIFWLFSFCSRFCWGISLVVVAALLVDRLFFVDLKRKNLFWFLYFPFLLLLYSPFLRSLLTLFLPRSHSIASTRARNNQKTRHTTPPAPLS